MHTGDDANPTTEWLTFVTHWTASVIGGYLWAAFISTMLPQVQWLDTAAWFLQGIAAPLSVMVTILFWA